MKKILFVLLAVTFVSSLCFAAQQSVETKTFIGKVDSISIGDAAKKIKSQIVVIDEKGQKLSFVVKPGTSITTKDGSVFTLSGIKKDNKVTVKYVTGKMGIHRAQSIELAG